MRAHSLVAALLAMVSIVSPLRTQRPAARQWTLDDAFAQLRLNRRDPYLEFVVLQLAAREGREDQFAQRIQSLHRGGRREGRQVDLFDLFTGALAVQESLQLDTMRGRPRIAGRSATVAVTDLVGPTVQSHPWKELLRGRQPVLSPLAGMVPEDFYFVQFRSVTKMLDVLDDGGLWAVHLFQQVANDATSTDVGARLRRQLAIETNKLLRPVYDSVVEEVGLCGSDAYVREGSDVTVLFRLKEPQLFRARMDQFLQRASETPGAERSDGAASGVPFVHVRTPDRSVHVFSAYPREDLHVRTNSIAALHRVLAAIQGNDGDGNPVRRLAGTDEYRYIRCLMPYRAVEEDGFIYLSDSFVRRIVGPTVKLTEQRRMVCYNHLRMIGHAALLHRTERGEPPRSLAALAAARCAPGTFGKGDLVCPDGGTYALAADATGMCSHHGHPNALRPCLEIPVTRVAEAEAAAYREFKEQYDQYWRRYFDPIAIRVKSDAGKYRLETIVLPLIDNSIYTQMAATLGGVPASLDALPVPTSSIFTVALDFEREALADVIDEFVPDSAFRNAGEFAGRLEALVERGLGTQIQMHVCDASPMFDFNLPRFFGEALGGFGRGSRGIDDEMLWVSFLLASLNSPVYLAIPVEDADVVDGFLDGLDRWLAEHARRPRAEWWWDTYSDFARLPDDQGHQIRSAALGFGPIKWRLFWARIDDALYVTSKRSLLRELTGARAPERGPTGHAMVKLRPKHWAQVLEDFRLGWADNNRIACLDNLGPLSAVARALGDAGDEELHDLAARIYGVHFVCPEHGDYRIDRERGSVSCSVHETQSEPRQPSQPDRRSDLGRKLARFSGLTATLTFLPEGLRAVVEIE